MMIKELHILDEAYGIRQGSRSDLRREVQEEVQKMRLKIAGSQGAISNLRKIKRLADHFFYNDPQGWDTFLNRMDKGELTIAKAVNFLKDKLAHESRERHPHLVPACNSEYTLYNSDSFGFEGLEDASVQCIVTSPPYYKMRDYNLGSNELGKEDTPWKFAKRLADFMNQAKRVLKSDGSLFVNLGDKVEEGNYTLSPQMFAILMKQNGWILNDEIVWTKSHCRPSPDVRANRNHEYIYHFVLNREFKYFPNAMTGRHQFPGSMRNSTVVTYKAQNDVRSRICTELGVPIEHTATYPEFIPLMAIKLSTEPGDLVVDPFTGSGTTGIVSLELGRKFVGYELNPEYFNVASTLIQHHINVSTRPAVQTSNDPVEVVAEIEDADQVEFVFE
jgi:DNA modification methylase